MSIGTRHTTSTGEVVLRLGKRASASLNRLEASTSSDFKALATAAGLNPKKDFIDADLSGLPFGAAKSDLRGFDFSIADLRSTRVREALTDATTVFSKSTKLDEADRRALRKRGLLTRPADKPPGDFDLKKVHAMILRGQTPKPSWRKWITELNFDSEKIFKEVAPLASLSNLRSLSFDSTGVADIAPLAGLKQLQRLSFHNTGVADIAPLAGLNNLQAIYVESEERRARLAPALGKRAGILKVSPGAGVQLDLPLEPIELPVAT